MDAPSSPEAKLLKPRLQKWSPTGQSPYPLHTLRRAEPSEAHLTTLLRSFERVSSSHSSSDAIGYGRRRPRPEGPCLHAEVLACRQTGVTARRRGSLRRRVKQGWNSATSDVGAPENRIHSPDAPGQSDSPRYLDRWSLPTLPIRIDHTREVRQCKSSLDMKCDSSSSTELSLNDFLPNLMKCIA